jgi:hypothetical protein
MQRRIGVLLVAALAAGCSTVGEAAPTTINTVPATTIAVTTTTVPPTTTTTTTSPATTRPSPCGDPHLDALYDACDHGDWVACDQLFGDAPAWSPCERFGDTCGNTTTTPRDARCQDLYAGITVPPSDWPGLPDD